MDFNLFRVKVFMPLQSGLFDTTTEPTDILREALLERPTVRSLVGRQWHLGNLVEIDSDGYYFALGRTARSTMPLLDEGTGNFVEAEFESAPYTHCVVDVAIEVCAIAKKPSLAPTPSAIARNLGRVLEASEAVRKRGASVRVSIVSDPGQFLDVLRSAYAIRAFTVTFTRPNPWDIERDFLAPMAKLAQETDSLNGATTLKGRALNEAPLEELTRSAAATGDNASARLELQEGHKLVRRSLHGDTATISEPALESPQQRASVLARIRAKYREIRNKAP